MNEPEAEKIRFRLEAWAGSIEKEVTGVFPEMPEGIVDRDEDVWESLIAIADAAGGEWPKRARMSAVTLVSDSKGSTPSLGVTLLADLKTVFADADVMSTDTILTALHGLEESPSGDLRGKPLDSRGLSRYLKPYGVKSQTVRIRITTAKGYRRADLHDPWSRYLSVPPCESDTPVTTDTPQPIVTPVAHVPDLSGQMKAGTVTIDECMPDVCSAFDKCCTQSRNQQTPP